MVRRREVLKGLGASALVPALARCGKGQTQPGMLDRPLHEVIDTVVILMMENRSFDHYFGALSLLGLRPEVDGLTPQMANPDFAGTLHHPFLADSLCIDDIPHGWNSCHRQWNNGLNDGFITEYESRYGDGAGAMPMGYFGPETLGPLYSLQSQFALCQRWFSSVLTSTWPNRYYGLAGQSAGEKHNTAGPNLQEMDTIFTRLNGAGIEWGVYAGNLSFLALLKEQPPHYRMNILERFYQDAAEGTLPNVCIVEPHYGFTDDHPPANPLVGQIMISGVYEALRKSPQWDRTLVVLNYDEHGGFFDHVSPPTAPDQFAEEGFGQMGFRVPAVVSGPWVKAGHLSSTIYDHTSPMAFIEHLWGLDPLTERDAAANDLTDLLDFDRIADNAPLAGLALPPIEATEDELYGGLCSPEWKSSHGGARTGQPELESLYNAMSTRHPLDRRYQQERIFDRFLESAQHEGLWLPKL